MNILLAEDEKQLSRALVTAMQATGYHVDPAYNGQEAVDLAGQRAYDVIILDIMMHKLKELLARLRSLERRSEDYQEDVLNFADITLDNDEQRLESHNSISLSGKETKLLAYLMKNPGKAIESSILLDQGWDKDDEADETDLWIYISYLHQKLQAVNAHVTIAGEKGGPFTLSQLA
ncbi:response regulator transcription factor [Limosilactobacillus fermentum]|uniref:response regulator transcription factor n=1 Tax=Limosilactobacillus fermentum TaxID=1613 RepID=UPI000C235695|nr:response regulator transcription factor [Limosilactobacillus fermentum]